MVMMMMMRMRVAIAVVLPVAIQKWLWFVGRSSRLCDLAVDHSAVSKLHCILVKTDGLIYMRDLGSTNGTRVNGQRVLRGALLPGDQISFGGATYTIHLGPDPQLSAGGPPSEPQNEMVPLVSDSVDELSVSNSDVKMLSDSDFLPAD